MITALILDFDGLMVDTETPAFESWRMLYAECGQELSLELWQHALGTNSGFDALTHLASLLAKGDTQNAPIAQRQAPSAHLYARRQVLKQQLCEHQPLLPGVLELLDQADELGFPCAVASSSGREWVEGWLRHHSVYERFVCIRTANDVTQTKPAPDLFLSAAAGMQRHPGACLVFEDSPNGIRAAQAAGMRCVAVPGAISSQLQVPPTDLVLPALNAMPLVEMLTHLRERGLR